MPDPEPSAPPPALDRQLFVDVVSAALSPCSLAPTCHLGPDGAFGQDFGFFPNTDSPAEIDANLAEVAAFLNLDDPAASAILVRGRDNHNDLILDDTQYCAIFDWIYAAVPEPAPMCTPP
jgi:hypothetical protein